MFYESEHLNTEGYLFHSENIDLDFSTHIHINFEFIYVYDGELQVGIEDKLHMVHTGQACLVLPNQPHFIATPVYAKSYLCVFSTHFLGDFYEKFRNQKAINPVFDLTSENIIECLKTSTDNPYLLKSCFYYILSLFVKNTIFTEQDARIFNFVEKVLCFAQNNYTKDIKLKDVAVHLGYDYHYFSTLFNITFRTNFLDFINKLRIAESQKLIVDISNSISQIASLSGFNTLRSFNRNFFKYTGKTPTDYRKTSL